MDTISKYSATMALLAVLAVAFGLGGTVAPVYESVSSQESSSLSSSSSATPLLSPPAYDSGWVDIRGNVGQYLTLTHGLNTVEVVVDIQGKEILDPMGATSWNKTFGGASSDWAYSMVGTTDGGFAIAGFTILAGGDTDFWLVKTDRDGKKLWSQTYGGETGTEQARSLIQTNDGGYVIAGDATSYGTPGGYPNFWLVKTDKDGNMLWNQAYGGTFTEQAYSVIQTSEGGYAIAGYTGFNGGDFLLVKTNSEGIQQWNRTYGGSGWEEGHSVIQTSEGGFAIAGSTSVGTGNNDFLLVKTDSAGNMQWSRTYGGALYDNAYCLIQTFGGYAMGGSTNSYGAGGSNDFWLVKTDPRGNALWNRTYGTTDTEEAHCLVQTFDGGYALAGHKYSWTPATNWDFWLVKTDSVGGMVGSRRYGGAQQDQAYAVVPTFGGYAMAGHTYSYGASGGDFWLVKLNVETSLEHQRNLGGFFVHDWNKTYGGTDIENCTDVVQTTDGGHALVGSAYLTGWSWDFWLVKTDSTGNVQWGRRYGGGTGTDLARSVVQTGDGGYAIVGSTTSFGSGGIDGWLVKTDAAGDVQWTQTYGSGFDDEFYCVVQTNDGGYAMAGGTKSAGTGYYDFWLVITNAGGTEVGGGRYGITGDDKAFSLVHTSDGEYALAGYASIGTTKNCWLVKTDSAGGEEWSRQYGGLGNDCASSVVQTIDEGYAIAGYTDSLGADGYDFYLIKADPNGGSEWSKTYGGTGSDYAYCIIQTGDEGYAIAGSTMSFGAGGSDLWLVKTDSAGNALWNKTYGGTGQDVAYSLVYTDDAAYALAGSTNSAGAGSYDFLLVKTDIETGLAWTGLTVNTITIYRGKTDPYWNYVRIYVWIVRTTWQLGDLNQDGIVDVNDLYILAKNYGKTFSP